MVLIEKTTLQEQAYNYLKVAIIEGKINESEIYSENYFADYLGISRTPVREAILKLRQEGLIESLPSRGLMVKSLSLEEILEIFQTRKAVEGYCSMILAENHRSQKVQDLMIKIGKYLEMQKEMIEKNEKAYDFMKIDEDFHKCIIECSNNNHFINLINNLSPRIEKLGTHTFEVAGRKEAALSEHIKIFESIKKGDRCKAYENVLIHLENAENMYIKEFKRG